MLALFHFPLVAKNRYREKYYHNESKIEKPGIEEVAADYGDRPELLGSFPETKKYPPQPGMGSWSYDYVKDQRAEGNEFVSGPDPLGLIRDNPYHPPMTTKGPFEDVNLPPLRITVLAEGPFSSYKEKNRQYFFQKIQN